MDTTCSYITCDKPGGLKCSGCQLARYCSKECQKKNFQTHKTKCIGVSKGNCFVIRATPTSAGSVLDNIPNQIQPLPLKNYGNEMAEKEELKQILGWKSATEVGKFYDQTGIDSWYYYVYGESGKNLNRPKNEAADLVCYQQLRPICGDVAVVRSGPDEATYPEVFKRSDISEAVEFHKTHDRQKIFTEREHNRVIRKFGRSHHDMPHFYNVSSQF